MNILEGFSKNDDLIDFVCTKCGDSLWVPLFIVEELQEDNIFSGHPASVPPQPFLIYSFLFSRKVELSY